ncbi:hypothetical protein GGR58DRAFT_506439 [Xylaria digitata]|nr:hypothetical protein GGR58DRAFT_506439 [Xylaria digitata]
MLSNTLFGILYSFVQKTMAQLGGLLTVRDIIPNYPKAASSSRGGGSALPPVPLAGRGLLQNAAGAQPPAHPFEGYSE